MTYKVLHISDLGETRRHFRWQEGGGKGRG